MNSTRGVTRKFVKQNKRLRVVRMPGRWRGSSELPLEWQRNFPQFLKEVFSRWARN